MAKKPTGEKAVFEAVWNRQNGLCFITGEYIPFDQVQHWNFPHILPKGEGRYLDFKLLETNIVMTIKRFHDLYDQGAQEKLFEEFKAYQHKLDVFFTLKETLIIQYELLYKNSNTPYKLING